MKFSLPAVVAAGLAAASPTRNIERSKSCPVNGTLPANYVKPSLIVNVSKNPANIPFGKTPTPLITPGDFCGIFNLELPPSASGKICQLTGKDGGHFSFTGYAIGTGATPQTTYNHQPAAGPNPPSPPAVLAPGNAYVINSAVCGLPPGLTELVISNIKASTSPLLMRLLNH
ncbi:hypothetical protein DL765_009640 [Monosporascus sp. GIB2]|nr:hypothetical protein DL765_009640 [Monosporascus sp. GIB2]